MRLLLSYLGFRWLFSNLLGLMLVVVASFSGLFLSIKSSDRGASLTTVLFGIAGTIALYRLVKRLTQGQ